MSRMNTQLQNRMLTKGKNKMIVWLMIPMSAVHPIKAEEIFNHITFIIPHLPRIKKTTKNVTLKSKTKTMKMPKIQLRATTLNFPKTGRLFLRPLWFQDQRSPKDSTLDWLSLRSIASHCASIFVPNRIWKKSSSKTYPLH